jgi:endonuclease/exonuclease/phosphatase family metal-dependent hydrolase
MINPNTLGIVYWNTWYRADPQEQLQHLQQLEEQLKRQRQAAKVILCLSEATLTTNSDDGLVNLIEQEGYATAHRPTSTLKPGLEECLAIASRDIAVKDNDRLDREGSTAFTCLTKRQGIRNFKTRWHGAIQVGENGTSDFRIATAHLSTIRPTSQELERTIAIGGSAVFGGDFNTLASKAYVEQIEQALGMVELAATNGPTATVPLIPWGNSGLGWRLDHVLVAPELEHASRLEVGYRGPSNHRPLLVAVPSPPS